MKRSSRLKWIKVVFVVVLVLMLFIPSSVNHPQIDMRAMVMALGVDSGEEGLVATVEIILPQEGGGSAGSSEVVDGAGKSLAEAFENLSISLGRKLEFNHCGIIAIGKEMAEKGVMRELEFLLSSGLVSPETNLTVSGNEDAKEFLKRLSEYSRKLSLTNLLRYTDQGAQNYSSSLLTFLRSTYSKSGCSAMPCIKLGYIAENSGKDKTAEVGKPDKQSQKATEGGGDKGSSGGGEGGGKKGLGQSIQAQGAKDSGGGEQGSEQVLIETARMLAAFKDGKLVNLWGSEQAYALAWLDRFTEKGYVFLDDVSADGRRLGDVALKLEKKKVKVKTSFEDGKPVYTLKFRLKFVAEDKRSFYAGQYNESKKTLETIYKAISAKAEQRISEAIFSAVEAAKTDKCDVFLVGDTFFRRHTRDFRRMKEEGFDFLQECLFRTEFNININ